MSFFISGLKFIYVLFLASLTGNLLILYLGRKLIIILNRTF